MPTTGRAQTDRSPERMISADQTQRPALLFLTFRHSIDLTHPLLIPLEPNYTSAPQVGKQPKNVCDVLTIPRQYPVSIDLLDVANIDVQDIVVCDFKVKEIS